MMKSSSILRFICRAITLLFYAKSLSLISSKDLLSCDKPSKFKVYIYDIPSQLLAPAVEARKNLSYHVCKKCIYEQFSLEYIIHDYFTQFCGRVFDPNEADYFYLPVIRDIQYRINLQTNNRQSTPAEIALLDAIEKNDFNMWKQVFNVTDMFWKRNNGSDHIIVMPAPVTNLRHQSNMRGFFHYMIQLSPPIFLNVEYSRSFYREYPICAGEKNLILPYPSTDPDLYSRRHFKLSSSADVGADSKMRTKLLFYQGGMHGSCTFVRTALSNIARSKVYSVQRGDRKREEGFQTAIFCPIPVGDSPSSKRMYDALSFGCIPVLLSDDAMWAFPGMLEPHLFSIQLPQRIVQRSLHRFLELSPKEEDFNYNGKPLPKSGLSLFKILMRMASDNSSFSSVSLPTGKPGKEDIMKKSENYDLIAESNTLVQLLKRIPSEDIKALREAAYNASKFTRYYQFNTSLPRSSPALTALNAFPDGGAVQLLENFLAKKHQNGILKEALACRNEAFGMQHKYINKYPCEKDRRRVMYEEESDDSDNISLFWRGFPIKSAC